MTWLRAHMHVRNPLVSCSLLVSELAEGKHTSETVSMDTILYCWLRGKISTLTSLWQMQAFYRSDSLNAKATDLGEVSLPEKSWSSPRRKIY